MDGGTVHAKDIDLVAPFYVESVMHTAAPGTGSSCLGAAASIPGTLPGSILAAGNLKAGKGGTVTFGHPSGTFSLTAEPVLAASPNDISFAKVAYPRTARIICDGTVYIKNERPTGGTAWKEADEITAESFYLEADDVSVSR
jgi:2-methylaconitate cis-trans-isomerase PrpF